MSVKVKYNVGFSIIEVIILIGTIATVLVSVLSGVIVTLKNAKSSEYKIMAVRQAQELYEWIRSEKDASWGDFYQQAENSHFDKDKKIYLCFKNVLNWDTNNNKRVSDPKNCDFYCLATDTDTECDSKGSQRIFRRAVKLTPSKSNDKVNIEISVYWIEGKDDKQVQFNSALTLWD